MEENPLVSIVVPALNEQVTVGEFVDWCKEGLQKAGVSGQILIVDSSSDQTAAIAEAHGAEVLRVPKRGLGQAYIDALPYVRGRYMILGDCDLTYDFREIRPFLEKLEAGSEFVMGSRFRGSIEADAMPPLHRYFGTPLTTWIMNRLYGSHFSDIHCGMRAMTTAAFRKINLRSQSWEYASEMVLKAVKLGMCCMEVPIAFYKDRKGRLSHHRRSGWQSSWIAGWINLKVMLLYAPDFFLMSPGWFLFITGLLLALSLVMGPYNLGPVQLNLHWMLLGLTMATLGYSAIQLGTLVRLFYNFDPARNERIRRLITYNRGMVISIFTFGAGFLLNLALLITWLRSGLKLEAYYFPAMEGLFLMILGFQTFVFTLMTNILGEGKGEEAEKK